MSLEKNKKVSKSLVKIIVASLMVIGFVTGIFYWKGMDQLKNPDTFLKNYYEHTQSIDLRHNF